MKTRVGHLSNFDVGWNQRPSTISGTPRAVLLIIEESPLYRKRSKFCGICDNPSWPNGKGCRAVNKANYSVTRHSHKSGKHLRWCQKFMNNTVSLRNSNTNGAKCSLLKKQSNLKSRREISALNDIIFVSHSNFLRIHSVKDGDKFVNSIKKV
jgi:hypothetical protein